jgi:hypothetical protein
MNTVEKNKIIANFLGRKGKSNNRLYSFKDIEYNGTIWFYDIELRFDKDWNWLMPVIKKIKSLGVPYGWGYHNAICASLIDCNIEETYKYCFEFIERYLLEINK